ncbi:hypothetical protein FNV43_RR19372 [Rhamnella rubrinervis]|uniref:NmrA-like domain-containing protein n=1 Tax=Rhamnella rubrinervis TaxID=2594499 RepID=A0A8K0GWU9_9ROSA|nr:hypothetical protein FNV43_RR19372 [Rhamnella rubrinervis]
MAQKNKILVIGANGYIIKFVVEVSAKAGHPTFALVGDTTVSDSEKPKLIDSFKSSRVTTLQGRHPSAKQSRPLAIWLRGAFFVYREGISRPNG